MNPRNLLSFLTKSTKPNRSRHTPITFVTKASRQHPKVTLGFLGGQGRGCYVSCSAPSLFITLRKDFAVFSYDDLVERVRYIGVKD
ncbi:hypothetical protein L2E82_52143 [Cichorium intybus]|nr:hypothetical protein L2E82_52143 [Cichorium intybus]